MHHCHEQRRGGGGDGTVATRNQVEVQDQPSASGSTHPTTRNLRKTEFQKSSFQPNRGKNDSNKCFFRFSSVSEKNYEKMAACEEQLRRLWTRSKHNRPKMQKYPEQNRCKSKQSHRYCAPALFHPCNFFVQKFVQEDSCCSRRMGISLTGTKT